MFIFTTTVVVLAVKFAVLFWVAKFFGLKTDQNLLVAFALSQIGEFSFVLVNYSTKLYLLNPELNAQLMAITAITMCVTPGLLIINEKFLEPKFLNIQNEAFDNTEPINQQKIIIVGFGHFGSTVGRLLRVNGIQATILDNDPERVNLLKSNHFKVYFGDATKHGILRSAGAETADLLILCLDDPEKNKFILEYARKKYPQLKIFVRAKNRLDAYDFYNNGVDNIYRETLGTAVDMAVDILKATGMRSYAARRLGKRFMMIDKAMVRKLAKEQLKDKITFTMKESLEREAELLAEDSQSFDESQWNNNEEI